MLTATAACKPLAYSFQRDSFFLRKIYCRDLFAEGSKVSLRRADSAYRYNSLCGIVQTCQFTAGAKQKAGLVYSARAFAEIFSIHSSIGMCLCLDHESTFGSKKEASQEVKAIEKKINKIIILDKLQKIDNIYYNEYVVE